MKKVVLDFLVALTALPLSAHNRIVDLVRESPSKSSSVSLAMVVTVCAVAYCVVLRLYLNELERAKPEETQESPSENEITVCQKICSVMFVVNILSALLAVLQINGIL